jgi:hypothetical protein
MMIIRLTEFLFNTTIICLTFTYIYIKSRKILIRYCIFRMCKCYINVYHENSQINLFRS